MCQQFCFDDLLVLFMGCLETLLLQSHHNLVELSDDGGTK